MNSFLRIIGACILFVLAGFVAVQQARHGQAAALSQAVVAPRQPAYHPDTQALGTAVQQILQANPSLDMSVSVIDMQTGERLHYGDPAPFGAASIAKLVTATLFLHEVELGQRSQTDSIGSLPARSQLEKLIVDSDNTAWHALNDALGHTALEAYAQRNGWVSYNARENTATSDDIASLLAQLAGRKLLNDANTAQLLGYMQRASMRDYIVAGAPAGALVYHKTGYLADRLHDSAILKKGDRSFVLVIFSKSRGTYNFATGTALFKHITDNASTAFFGQP